MIIQIQKSKMALDKIIKFSTWFTICTLITVNIVHLSETEPTLKWPDGRFISEANAISYKSVFSLGTFVLINHWTPFLFAAMLIACQWPKYRLDFIMGDSLKYGIFLVIVAIFGNFAYAGSLGIVLGIINLVLAFLALLNATVLGNNESPSFFA